MMVSASRNVTRGHVDVTPEDVASALDVTDEAVSAIFEAMQGRFLNETRITSWGKRQPIREDLGNTETGAKSAAQRKREQREREKQQAQASHVTQCHAESQQITLDTDTDKDIYTSSSLRSEEVVETPVSPLLAVAEQPKPVVDNCPHQQIIDAYHEELPMCPRIREWTPARAQALRTRWRERPERQCMEWWRNLFAYCAKSDFLTGKARPAPGRKPFELSLDWLIKAENFAKVLEGRYENEGANAGWEVAA